MRFNIYTSGKGVLPSGRMVGFIGSDHPKDQPCPITNEEIAEEALIASGQVQPKHRGFFVFQRPKAQEKAGA